MYRPPGSHHADRREETESETEQSQGGPPWQAEEPERRRSTDEGMYRPHVPLLTRAFRWPSPEQDEPPPRFQSRFSPSAAPPLTPNIDPPSGTVSVPSYHGYSESRLLQPPLYMDSQYGRHRSAPLYGSEDWDRRMTFGTLPPPGEGSSSRVVLPPVRHLLGELGMLSPGPYEGVRAVPQLRVPEGPMGGGSRESGETVRGKRGREGEEKRAAVRKIYVACDFCRGRKLRCDGGRPGCSNCETRSLACKYQEHPRRRGPGKAPKGSRGKKAGKKAAGEDGPGPGPSGVS